MVRQILSILLASFLLTGCDYHKDSVYLGRAEARLLADVSDGNLEAVKTFLDIGGNINLQDEPGMALLHHAVNANWKGTNLPMIKLLIERGADVKKVDDTHHTPLHMASNKEAAQMLIDAGANPNARTQRSGETLLFSAAWGAAQGHPKSYEKYLGLTKLLLDRGADVTIKLKSGDTVLHKVARNYSEQHASEVCELLIANGAKVNELNAKGQTPLDEAMANERNKTAAFLRKNNAQTGEELIAGEN